MVDPNLKGMSTHVRFDNFLYKELARGNAEAPHYNDLTSEGHKEAINKFAEDKQELNNTFQDAFVKLANLGHNEDDLKPIYEIIDDMTSAKLSLREYNWEII